MRAEKDPFAGLTGDERKRAQERIILELLYKLGDFALVTARERPDFALHTSSRAQPFGVEITQLFPDESRARMYMVPGYIQSLWEGGRHLHKDDVDILSVENDIVVTDPDGNVKHKNLTGIVVVPPKWTEFRSALAATINHKSELAYDADEFSHINLGILDWFHLQFDASESPTDLLLDDKVRDSLVSTPFREVYLLIYDTGRKPKDQDVDPIEVAKDGARKPHVLKRVALKQIALIDRFYCACYAIDEHLKTTGREDAASNEYINRLACRIVAQLLRCSVIAHDGTPFVLFGANAIALTDNGVHVLDYHEHTTNDMASHQVADCLPANEESSVLEALAGRTLVTGFPEDAHDAPSLPRPPHSPN